MKNIEERANAISVLCSTLFGSEQTPFRVKYWAECFPVEDVLYALVEAKSKQRREPTITASQLAIFTERVLLRRFHDEQMKRRHVAA